MEAADPLSRTTLEQAITPAYLRGVQLITAALALGVFTFAGIVVVLSTKTQGTPSPAQYQTVQLLSMIHFLMLVSTYGLIPVVYKRMVLHPVASPTPAEAISQLRTAEVVRLAMMEGVALLGLVTCLLGVTNGVIQEEPWYWANILSALLMLGFVASSFPNKERLLFRLLLHYG